MKTVRHRRPDGLPCDDTCLYCDRPLALTVTHEHDHIPTPARHGGTDTFCVCRECHSLKDRQSLTDWDPDLVWKAVMDAWAALSPEGRIFLAQTIALLHDVMEERGRLREVRKTFEERTEA